MMEHEKPWWAPKMKSIVRAILAIMLTGAAIVSTFYSSLASEALYGLAGSAITFYFTENGD
jgi:hypothetical protein